jgi:hypothetical protein
MKKILIIFSLALLAISCNSSTPDKALVETLASIDESGESGSRFESGYLSYAKWKNHIFEDFGKAKAIVSEEPINKYSVGNFSAIDGQCYPHNYIFLGKDTAVGVAKLAGLHSVLLKYMDQLNEKLLVKEGLEENRELFKSEKKYDASIALVDKSIKESIDRVLFACDKLNEFK